MLQVLAAGGTVGLAGCAGDGDESSGETTAPEETEDATEETIAELQGSVNVALGQDPTLEVWDVYGGVMPYYTNILEPLIWVSDELEMEPWLATDWEQTSETTWRFDLRQGVTFHNGDEMTAQDVVFSFEAILEEWAWAPGWLKLEPGNITAVDDYTVEFETTKPYPPFAGTIAHNMVAVQHRDRDRDANEVIGTGPLQVEEIVKEQEVVTSRFEDYWNDRAAMDEVVFSVISDPTTRSLSLTNHEIDVAFAPPRSRVDDLDSQDGTDIHKETGTGAGYAGINLYLTPTDDRTLRRALNHAISQELLVDTILEGVGQPAEVHISPTIYWSAHGDVPVYGKDEGKGADLVDQSSYDGEELTILVPNDMVDGREIAQVLQDAFSNIGVNAKVQVLERSAYTEAERNGEAHVILKTRGPNSAAADYVIYESHHSDGDVNQRLHREEGTGLHNPPGETGEKVDSLLEEGFQTNDPAVKKDVYGQVQEIIMDEAVTIPLFYSEYLVGTRQDVSGLDLRPIQEFTRWTDLEHTKS